MGAATKAYLVAYNAAQTWGWLACLLLLARSIAQGKSPEAIYHDVAPVLGEQLADRQEWVQGSHQLRLLEGAGSTERQQLAVHGIGFKHTLVAMRLVMVDALEHR